MLAHFEVMIALLLGLLTIGVMNVAQAAPSEEFVISKDGIELVVLFVKTANPAGMQVNCKVSNRNQSDVQFTNTGPTMGLAFKLLDSSAEEIAPQVPWSGFITSESILDTLGKRSRLVIKPNESVEFNLALHDAFGDAWRSGAKLFIEWIPGDDGAGNPLQIGKGLETSFDLTGEQPRQSQRSVSSESKEAYAGERQSLPQKPTTPKKAPEATPTASTPNEEPASSMPWSIIVVLIVAATILLWLLVKKRK